MFLQIDPDVVEDQRKNSERKKLKLKEVHLTKLLSTKARGTGHKAPFCLFTYTNTRTDTESVSDMVIITTSRRVPTVKDVWMFCVTCTVRTALLILFKAGNRCHFDIPVFRQYMNKKRVVVRVEEGIETKNETKYLFALTIIIQLFMQDTCSFFSNHIFRTIEMTFACSLSKVAVHSFVENLFKSIWGMQHNKAPLTVKYFFDFLDAQADNMKITDPDVLHIWKTNRSLTAGWIALKNSLNN